MYSISGKIIETSLEDKFTILKNWYLSDTNYYSSMDQMKRSDPFKRLVLLGPEIVPLIIRELSAEPSVQWILLLGEFMELPYIPEESRGRLLEVSEIIVKWYENQPKELRT